jgi:hypothetical protein
VAVVAIILGLLAVILLPSYLGAGDEGPEMPTVRERLRR